MRLLKTPLLHFLIGGALLFWLVNGATPWASSRPASALDPIVVTAADVARLRTEYTRETGLEATPADEAALVEKTVEEELLFREALVRGLDRNDRSVRNWLIEQMAVLTNDRTRDPDALYAQAEALDLGRTDLVVRRILVQKMRLLAARAGEQTPDDDVLRSFYAARQDDYRSPARVDLWHVFLASARHGTAMSRDADALLAGLRRKPRTPAAAALLGDAFSVPPHLVSQSKPQLEKLFGAEFAAAVLGAEVGTWSGPVPSSYGLHLVWVESREAAKPPSFETVRGQVLERWQDEHRTQRVVELLRDLELRYPIQVESAAWRSRTAS